MPEPVYAFTPDIIAATSPDKIPHLSNFKPALAALVLVAAAGDADVAEAGVKVLDVLSLILSPPSLPGTMVGKSSSFSSSSSLLLVGCGGGLEVALEAVVVVSAARRARGYRLPCRGSTLAAFDTLADGTRILRG